MKRLPVALVMLVAVPVAAQKPWDVRVDLPVPVPVELPAIPPTNPFAGPVAAPPTPLATPMAEKLDAQMEVEAAVYVDRSGVCRRAVLLRNPVPGANGELTTALLETTFTPAQAQGETVPVWVSITFALAGRIKEGRAIRVTPTAPDLAQPPAADAAPLPIADARDLSLPATPSERVDVLPGPRRFHASLSSRALRQACRIMAEVTPGGRCARVVFLSCPEGLRPWLLRSLAGWTFHPAMSGSEPVAAWVQLEGDFDVELSSFSAERLRVSSTSAYPRAAVAAAAAPPHGG